MIYDSVHIHLSYTGDKNLGAWTLGQTTNKRLFWTLHPMKPLKCNYRNVQKPSSMRLMAAAMLFAAHAGVTNAYTANYYVQYMHTVKAHCSRTYYNQVYA